MIAVNKLRVNNVSKRPEFASALSLLKASPAGGILLRVAKLLDIAQMRGYLVGGLVRDVLLGSETADIDLAIPGDGLDFAGKVAADLGGSYVPLDVDKRVGRVVLNDGWELDFSSFDDSIELDLARRDFTVNAMAIDLFAVVYEKGLPHLIDPFRGRDDLRRRVVRAVKNTVFIDDPVRLLRAVRLSAELDFHIERQTQVLMRHGGDLISRVAGERVREELLRILGSADSGSSLFVLDKLGVLTGLFPELASAKGVTQPKEHSWDVFTHSLRTAQAVDFVLHRGKWPYRGDEALSAIPWSADIERYFEEEISCGSTRGSLLKLAGLLHDVAKPRMRSVDPGGRIRFIGHDREGAAVAEGILGRLRFSNRESRLVATEIEHHMRPGQMNQEKMPSLRAIYRLFRDAGEAGLDTLYLSLADHLAARGPAIDIDHWRQHTGVIEYVVNQRFEQDKFTIPLKLLDGNDLIERFGMQPGPLIGEILESVREAQAVGEITTTESAINLVTKLLKRHK